MKKIILLISLSILVSVTVMGQLGVRAGGAFAQQSGNSQATYSEAYLSNFQFGIFTYKDIIPLLKLRIGLDYIPKGTNWESGSSYSQKQINYIELPVLARVKLGPIYGLGGFYGGYAIGGKNKLNTSGDETETDIDFDASNLSRWDYGMKFGLGFQLGLGPIHAFAELDYSFGLNNLNTGVGTDKKNSVIGVTIGVLLGN